VHIPIRRRWLDVICGCEREGVSGLCSEAELTTTRDAVATTRDGVQAMKPVRNQPNLCKNPSNPVKGAGSTSGQIPSDLAPPGLLNHPQALNPHEKGWKCQRSDPLWLGTSWSTQPPREPPREGGNETTQQWNWSDDQINLYWIREVSNNKLKRVLKIQPPNFNTCSAETSIEVWKLAYRRTETRKRNGGNKKRKSFVDELADTWCNGKSRG
jgi:hypothetical protein